MDKEDLVSYLNVPWLQIPGWGCDGPTMNSRGFLRRAVVSSATLPLKSATPCVRPSRASSSADGSLSSGVGCTFGECSGEGSELLAALSSTMPVSRVSSGEPATVCASRKLLGVTGEKGIDGFREEDVGLRVVISSVGPPMLCLHGESIEYTWNSERQRGQACVRSEGREALRVGDFEVSRLGSSLDFANFTVPRDVEA